MKSGNLNFVETSEPLQACNGTALRLTITYNGAGRAVIAVLETKSGTHAEWCSL